MAFTQENFTLSTQAIILYQYIKFENYTFKITVTSPRGQEINMQIIKKNTKVVTSQRHTVRENSWLSQFLQNTNEKKIVYGTPLQTQCY